MRKKRRIAWMNVGLRSIINVIKATDWSHPACGFLTESSKSPASIAKSNKQW